MQRWTRIHEYAKQYQKWVYKTYIAHGHGYLCTYYNLDLPNSIYDSTILDSGSYEQTGDHSGLRWRKILLLPVFHIEQIQPGFSTDEEGFTKKEQVSSFTIPTEYEFQPSPMDFVKFDQEILHPNNKYPLYQVVHFEKATNTERTLWKVNLKINYKTETDLNEHISQVCIFCDYTKKIYESEKGTMLFRLFDKNERISIINEFYNPTLGLYFQER